MNAQKLTGAQISEMNNHHHSALVQDEDGTLRVIPSLRGEALAELPDTSTVLRYPAQEWAADLLAAERDRLGADAKAVTVRAQAAREATEELAAEARREESMLPPFWTVTDESLSVAELLHWRKVVESLPPLLLP